MRDLQTPWGAPTKLMPKIEWHYKPGCTKTAVVIFLIFYFDGVR